MKYRILYLAILAVMAIAWSSTGARAGDPTPLTFTVDSLDDLGSSNAPNGICESPCRLRDALVEAEGHEGEDTINFDPSLFTGGAGTITLVTALPVISQNITIDGPGSAMLTVDANASAGAQRRVFTLTSALPCFEATISGMTLTGGYIVGDGDGDGGAIRVNQDHILNLTDVVVAGNYVENDGGGGIYFNLGELHLTDSMVMGNEAAQDEGGGEGGGIYGYGTLTLTNTDVTGNTAGNQGGGIYLYGSGGPTITGGMINLNAAGSGGGGLYLSSSTGGSAMLTGALIASNTSESDGGGISVNAGGYDLTLTDSDIENNEGSNGGGLYLVTSGGNLVVTGSSVVDNDAGYDGGGIYWASTTAMIGTSLISGNMAGSYGGGINANFAEMLEIEATSIVSNSADYDGGGIALYSVTSSGSLLNNTISGNSSNRNGGGLYVSNSGGANIQVTHNTIASNTADADSNGSGDGGGIYPLSGALTLTNSIIAGNDDASDLVTLSTKPPPVAHDDCSGTVTSNGVNLIGDDTGCSGLSEDDLIGDDPMLGELIEVPGLRIAIRDLLLGSAAINAADPATCAEMDAIGQTRNEDACDIGAVESISLAIYLYKEANGGCTIGASGGAVSSMSLLLLAIAGAFAFERRRRRS